MTREPIESTQPHRVPVSWQAWLMVLIFLVTTLFSAGMGWSRSNVSIDNIALSISRLEGEVHTLSEKYAISDKATAQELQKLEDHINYDDARLDKLETAKGH